MNLVYTRHVEMGLFGDVCPKKRFLSLFPIAMIYLMADMQVVIKLPPRYFELA